MEELLQLLEKINSYVSDKNYLLNQIHNEGILENDHRKSFQKAKDEKVFSDNELRTIITYFKIANFIEKFQKKIEAYVKSAKLEISRVSNSNSKERLIIEVLNKSTISLNHIKTKFEDELAPLDITEEDLSILFEFSLINPKEIKIDLVDFHMNRVKNSSIILTNDFLKKILEIINKYDLINRLYLVFIYITENTLYKQLDEFILKYSSDLSNISVYDKKKANVFLGQVLISLTYSTLLPLPRWLINIYFFLYPAGHLGFTAVTFLVIFPLTQVMVVFLANAALSAAALAAASSLAFISAAALCAASLFA